MLQCNNKIAEGFLLTLKRVMRREPLILQAQIAQTSKYLNTAPSLTLLKECEPCLHTSNVVYLKHTTS